MIPTKPKSRSIQLGNPHSTHTPNVALAGLIELKIDTRSVQAFTNFQTVHELHPSVHAINSYTFNILAFAIDPATGTSVNLAQFRMENWLEWFTIFSNGTRTTAEFTHHTTSGPTTTEVESHVLAVEIRRSGWARTFNMCILAESWILAVGAVHFSRKRASGWVAVVAAALRISWVLTIATIRSLYIGTPPFGSFLGMFLLPGLCVISCIYY